MSLREKSKKKKENRILNSAMKLFEKKGFNETKMEEIAHKAEVGVGTLYSYYNSKGQLLFSILKRKAEPIISEVEKLIEQPENTLIDSVIKLINLYNKIFISFDKEIIREFFAHVFTDKRLRAEGLNFDQQFIDQALQILKVYSESGLIKINGDLANLSLVLYNLYFSNYLIYVLVDEMEFSEFEQLMRDQLTLVLQSFIEEGKN